MEQSPFVRYHLNRFEITPSNNQNDQHRHKDKGLRHQDFMDFQDGANIYIKSLEENPQTTNSAAKKQRKIKVFGIPQNRIRKEQYIAPPLGNIAEREKSETVDQMLIDSNLHIKTQSYIQDQPQRNKQNAENDNENQLQKLLYFSGSSASLPPAEPIASNQGQESAKTSEVDQIIQKEVPRDERQMKQSQFFPSRINFPMKNTNSSYLADNTGSRAQLKQNILDKISVLHNQTRQQNSKILQIQHHSIANANPILDVNFISPIPKKNDQIVQTSMWIDDVKEPKISNPLKQERRPMIPRPKKAEKVSENSNIKNYLQSYGKYGQQIESMITKFQKVSNLKGKEEQIHRQIQSLTHKRHQSVGRLDNQSQQLHKRPLYSNAPTKRNNHAHIFAQSASNFVHNSPAEEGNEVQRQLKKDIIKIQHIIDGFKQFSHIVSKEDVHTHIKSEKNFKIPKQQIPMMFRSQKYAAQSIQLPAYSCKKSNSQPYIDIKGLEMIQNFNDSQEFQSQNCTWRQKDIIDFSSKYGARPPIAPYCPNTVRTEKKPLCGNSEGHKPCECSSHAQLAQQIARLSQKIQQLEREKQQRKSIEDYDQPRKTIKEDNHNEQNNLMEESSFVQPLPMQKQEQHSSHNVKYSQSVSKQKERFKSGQLKSSQLQRRIKSKDLPPKPKNARKSPQIKKQAQKYNDFQEAINLNQLKIKFPTIYVSLTCDSSENSIIKFGETTFFKLFSFAIDRQGLKNGLVDEKSGFKIKKYDDYIHYYIQNTLNYHLICYFKGKIYFGQIRQGHRDCKQGYGFYSTSKYSYEGQFQLDRKHGQGTINYANGDIYSGSWNQGKKEGEGILLNSAGDIFKGTFHNGKKNGSGEQRLKNGDFYRGQFKQGKLEGLGTYWWQDGSVYQGEFKDGLLHGKGVWRSKENDSYEGQYRQNKKHGKGIYRWSNGMIFTGVFQADQQISSKKVSLPPTERKSSKSGRKNERLRQISSKKGRM